MEMNSWTNIVTIISENIDNFVGFPIVTGHTTIVQLVHESLPLIN